jgi:hypothetical protein
MDFGTTPPQSLSGPNYAGRAVNSDRQARVHYPNSR